MDPSLTAIADERVVEIQSDFSHNGWYSGTAEVIAWNSGSPDPAAHALGQWRDSPPHWAILTDPSLTRIGCAHAHADGRDWFVCVLANGTVTTAPQPTPQPSVEPEPEPVVEVLPDAAMELALPDTSGEIMDDMAPMASGTACGR
jgi:hypothetical protein